MHKSSTCSDSTLVHYNIWFYLARLKVTRFYQYYGAYTAPFDVHKGSIYTFLPGLPYFL